MTDILLLTPPFTQLNTPYPATAYLTGFLNTKGYSSHQMDLGIAVILELFTAQGLQEVFAIAEQKGTIQSENEQRIFALSEHYIQTVEPVISFLQGKQPTMARQICSGNFLPQASRFEQLEQLDWAFGNMGLQDQAKHLCTLYLEDLSDFISGCVDPHFGFSQYAERLGRSANQFDELHQQLNSELSFIDGITIKRLEAQLKLHQPKLVCLSVPFPGNLLGAFRCGQFIKKHFPATKVAMGGGFPNTELRSLTEVRVFDYVDYISLDDGELPVELLLESLNSTEKTPLKRTYVCENGAVVYRNDSERADYKQADLGTPDYTGLPLADYIHVIGIANPMHSLWSDGRWNKLTMAHGCYWGKCTFCDISLDYIKLYEPLTAKLLVDRMEVLIAQTGETGFHFVDEAAPPALMRALALEILKRKLVVTWWTNIRFEKSFTHELCVLLKHSGCIAVSGGLEVASDRLLKLIDKGVTVEQVAQVTNNLTASGIMVHAYLMYGYPTQTVQETMDSLEMVRQLFELGIVQSGFWHQFALTANSPIGHDPKSFGLQPQLQPIAFANNDIQFEDQTGIDHAQFSFGLKKSLFNYMNGVGFELPIQDWFDFKVPPTTISANFIETAINTTTFATSKPSSKPIWLGGQPLMLAELQTNKIKQKGLVQLIFHSKNDQVNIRMNATQASWFTQQLDSISITAEHPITLAQLKSNFERELPDFELFWYSKPLQELRTSGLLIG